MRSALILVSIFCGAYSQTCGYFRSSYCNTADPRSSCYGNSIPLDACATLGGTSVSYKCNAAGDMITMNTGANCATAGTPMAFNTSISRCGASCFTMGSQFSNTGCTGTATGMGPLYTGGECWNGAKQLCDANYVYLLSWNATADPACPANPTDANSASMISYKLGACLPSTASSTSFASCSNPQSASGMLNTNTEIIAYTDATCGAASEQFKVGQIVKPTCQSMTKSYCDGAAWSFSYTDAACTMLDGVTYTALGCVSGAAIGSTGSIKLSCLSPTTPPSFSFGANVKVGQMTLYSDSACTKIVGGVYAKDGQCNAGSKLTCAADGLSGTVMEYAFTNPGYATCTGTANSTYTLSTTTCVMIPGTSPAQYGKAVSCGVPSGGSFSPGNAPGVTLSKAGARSGVVAAVVALVFWAGL